MSQTHFQYIENNVKNPCLVIEVRVKKVKRILDRFREILN